MAFQLVIFDCDGTLVESELANNTIIAAVLAEIGLPQYDVSYCLENFTGNSIPDIVDKINNNLQPQAPISYEEMMFYIRAMEKKCVREIKAVNGADDLLSNLHIDKCVVSNGERNAVINNLRNAGLLSYFVEQDIFTREQVARPKPAPDLFLRAALMKSVELSDSLVVEDSAVGVIAAKQAGMKVCGFVGTSSDKNRAAQDLKDAGADLIISEIKEVLAELGS